MEIGLKYLDLTYISCHKYVQIHYSQVKLKFSNELLFQDRMLLYLYKVHLSRQIQEIYE